MVADAPCHAGLLKLEAGLVQFLVGPVQFPLPIILAVVVDPFQDAAGLDLQIVQHGGGLPAELLQRGGQQRQDIDRRYPAARLMATITSANPSF